MTPPDGNDPRRRWATVLGWVSGGFGGVLLNLGVFALWGEGYPVQPTSFIAFVLGAFGGMAAADRLGDRAFSVLGVATGVVVALGLSAALLLLAR